MRIKFRGSINNKCVINIDQTLYYIPKTAKSCYIMYGYKYINKCIRPTSWHFLCDRFQEVLGSHVDDPFVLHWSKLQKPHFSVRGWRLFLLWILLKLISKVLWQSLSGVITVFYLLGSCTCGCSPVYINKVGWADFCQGIKWTSVYHWYLPQPLHLLV